MEEMKKEKPVEEKVGQKENKMGVMPINKLLLTMAIPMMISMIVQALYNIVDSIFVAKLGQDAFNAVSFSFPVQNVIIAIASGTGVGMNALISRSLGEKNPERANGFAMHGLFLAIVSSMLVMIIGGACAEWFFLSQTTNQAVIVAGTDYVRICALCSFGVMGQIIFERLLQSTGKTFLSMLTQGFGAIINLILDPILIFGLLGCPKMGVAGAAWATVIGQIGACGFGLVLNIKYNKELSLNLKKFRLDFSKIKEIYRIGFPSILMQSIGSIMTYMMNRLLIDIEQTETAAAVFGAYFKLQSFVIMPVIGLGNALTPIIAFNLGARRKDRMKHAYRLGLVYAISIMLVGAFAMIFFPQALLKLFDASASMTAMGEKAFRIVAIALLFAGYCITTSNFFQACGKSVYSLWMSLIRQLIVLIPLAYLFGYAFGYQTVWYAVPLAELASVVVAMFGYRAINKKMLADLEN